MNPTYYCSACKEDKPSTEVHWTPSSLKLAVKHPNRTGIGYCRSCSKNNAAAYTKKLKDARLTRSRKPIERNIRGKLYIIGPKENKKNQYPYKIGISSGTTIQNRLITLQTGHWIDLTVLYESEVLDHIHKIETKLHEAYKTKRIRGEWFKINAKDIEDIIETIK